MPVGTYVVWVWIGGYSRLSLQSPLQSLIALKVVGKAKLVLFVGELEEIKEFGRCLVDGEGWGLGVVYQDWNSTCGGGDDGCQCCCALPNPSLSLSLSFSPSAKGKVDAMFMGYATVYTEHMKLSQLLPGAVPLYSTNMELKAKDNVLEHWYLWTHHSDLDARTNLSFAHWYCTMKFRRCTQYRYR